MAPPLLLLSDAPHSAAAMSGVGDVFLYPEVKGLRRLRANRCSLHASRFAAFQLTSDVSEAAHNKPLSLLAVDC